MSNIVSMSHTEELTMTSREIAEMTGKRHDHVMRDIRIMCEQLEIQPAQFCAQHKDSTGRTMETLRSKGLISITQTVEPQACDG